MSGLPWGKFYWGDWENDPGLRVCSLAARGLWMNMLCIAAKSGRYGFVLLGGKPPSTEDLARLVGAPVEEVAAMIEELECRGIFSRDRNGTIYCRRMVRDERERPAKIKAGKIGGRVTHEKQKGIFKLTGTALSRELE